MNSNVHIIGQTPLVDIDRWFVAYNFNRTFIVKTPNGVEDGNVAMRDKSVLQCEDAIRYDTPVHPVPTAQGMSLSVSNVVMPLDAMTDEVELNILVTGTYAFRKAKDKEHYKNFIQQTLQARKEAEARLRVQGGVGG